MKKITLKVNKAYVYEEVAETTSYIGAKTKGDEQAYDRIFTTDDDRMMLERFWVEACDATTELLKPFIFHVSEQKVSHGLELEKDYEITLELSNAFEHKLTGSIETSLFNFFVSFIVGRWYKFADKAEAETYLADAKTFMNDIRSKTWFRTKPTRLTHF